MRRKKNNLQGKQNAENQRPYKNVWRKPSFDSMVISGIFIALLIIMVLLSSCDVSPYRIENPRMTLCNESIPICILEEMELFEPTDDMCVAWTDVNRSASDTLSLFVYDNFGEQISASRDDAEGIATDKECRSIPIDNLGETGTYHTEFATNGRPAESVYWSIITTTPTPTPTLTPSPPPIIPPPYSIENPRMTLCNADIHPCLVEGISQFSLTDEICAAWTEVGRSSYDLLAFFVYDEEERQIFSYVEFEPDTIIGRRCRVEPIGNPSVLGAYQTEFTANFRPAEQIFWSINSVYHMSGEIGCIGLRPTLFFEGNVDIAINEGEFLIIGEGTDYSSTDIIFVEVSGIFDGTEVSLGTIQMYHEPYGENNQIEPFRVDSFDGVFQDFELYSEAQQVEEEGCDIYTRLYLEDQE